MSLTLVSVAATLLIGAAVAAAVLAGHSLWRVVVVAHRDRLHEAARVAVMRLGTDGTDGTADVHHAARLLRRMQVRRRAEMLISDRVLAGPDRRQIAHELAVHAGVTQWAYRQTRRRAWHRRAAGVRTLTAVAVPGPGAIRLATDPKPLVRTASIRWLGRGPVGSGAAAVVVAAMSDPSAAVRTACHYTLAAWGGAGARLAGDVLTSGDVPAVVAALTVLAAVPDLHRTTVDEITRLTRHPEAAVRAAAVRASGAVGIAPPGHDDVDASVRAAWCRVSASLAVPTAAPDVLALLADPDGTVRHEAAKALLAYGPIGRVLLRTATGEVAAAAAALMQQDLIREGRR